MPSYLKRSLWLTLDETAFFWLVFSFVNQSCVLLKPISDSLENKIPFSLSDKLWVNNKQ